MGKATFLLVGNGFTALMDQGTDLAIHIWDGMEDIIHPKYGPSKAITIEQELQQFFINTEDAWDPPGRQYFNADVAKPNLIPNPSHPSGLRVSDYQEDTFTHKLVRYLLENDNPAASVMKGYKPHYDLFAEKEALNIVYVANCSYDFKPLRDTKNSYEDIRCLLRFNHTTDTPEPEIIFRQEATIDPGAVWVEGRKGNPNGAAQIYPGQQQSWGFGYHLRHKYGTSRPCLFQIRPCAVLRDYDQDFTRKYDKVFIGFFGINQHCGLNSGFNSVGYNSAGCLVGRNTDLHLQYLRLLRTCSRYKTNPSVAFNTTVVFYDWIQEGYTTPQNQWT